MKDTVTIRFNDEEKVLFENAAKLYNCSISSAIKRLAIEKIEDEMDIEIIRKYEELKKNKKLKTRPIEDFLKNLSYE